MRAAFRFRLFTLALAIILPCQASLCQEIGIAGRKDARPFVWQDDGTGQLLGFLWDICTRATQRAGYSFRPIPIESSEKDDFLASGAGNYDLLCDPTTITLYRMKNFMERIEVSHLVFSPIVFVANGSYARHDNLQKAQPGWGELSATKAKEADCSKLSKQAADGIPIAGTSKRWITMVPDDEKVRIEIWGYVKGATIGAKLERDKALDAVTPDGSHPLICLQPFASHKEAAEAFCTNRLARYFGDADIIKATIKARSERPGGSCKSGVSFAADGTYEPYALVTSSRNCPEFPKRFAYALYEMFADGTVDRLFVGHFGAGKSDYVRTLFQINSVPRGMPSPTAPPN